MPSNHFADDVQQLLAILPPGIRAVIEGKGKNNQLIEIVLDLGRTPEIRLSGAMEIISDLPVSREDLDYVVNHVGRFNDDNRAGIERTLHRISAMRNRLGVVVGITC